MKKLIIIMSAALLAVNVLTACGSEQNSQISEKSETVTVTESITEQTSAETSKTESQTERTEVSDLGSIPEFNFDTRTVTLNSGYEMPILGIGTYRLSNDEAENSVYWALHDGYRMIDTARIYGNEEGVGRGIRKAIDEGFVTREEIFVTTKMWTADFDNGDEAINNSLDRLGLDYVDLMILHHSQPSNDVQAYQAMERAVNDGKLKSIGLSNFYTPENFDRIVEQTTITPAE